jgi:hypothetical protein
MMRGRNFAWIGVFAALLTLLASPAAAIPIFFFHEGNGSGTLNGVPFGPSDFEITSVADTLNRQSFGGGFFIDHTTSTIAIGGVGVFQVLTPTRTFNNQSGSIVGYSRAGAGGLDLFNGPTHASFATWDMLSSIGPIAGNGSLLQWTSSPVITSGGVLEFNSAPTFAVFEAIIPEPTTLAMAIGAMVPTALRRRKR